MDYLWLEVSLVLIMFLTTITKGNGDPEKIRQKSEDSLTIIHDISTGNTGTLCITESYRTLPSNMDTYRFDSARQKADLGSMLLQYLGMIHHTVLHDGLARSLIMSDEDIFAVRVLSVNETSGILLTIVSWRRPVFSPSAETDGQAMLELGGPRRDKDDSPRPGIRLSPEYPWYEEATSTTMQRSPKFMTSPENSSFKGWWTHPYYSCSMKRWLLSYSIVMPSQHGKHGVKGFLSLDIDISSLDVNQCDITTEYYPNQLMSFRGTHKCHRSTQCKFLPGLGWSRGAYQCVCKPGYYSFQQKGVFNGTLVEVAWLEQEHNVSAVYSEVFQCLRCAPGCDICNSPAPCLATYNWPFRISLLVISVACALFTLTLIGYVYQHRRLKVFKVASPIFLSITLCGCATMYLEMAAIFPVLDMYSCIATKWSRHLGFCITYTALLMKTWRVSLTYRVKSAHKVKLTDKQLLQWMVPILLVMLIYLGTWTLSAPPVAENISDKVGHLFKQCSYNWWDHSLAIGEVLFLLWGIRVCYNVRNAESLYNEARLISYAIYNIAVVNLSMITFHLSLFPQAGPDIKYLLGFIRTQLSTSVTVGLVFGPKIVRVLRGQGDQWDSRARARGVTASFSLNGIGLVPEEAPDLYQENEELKEEIQKLAAQIEYMRIVHMEMNNRHLKPKTGGYFNSANPAINLQSPMGKSGFLIGRTMSADEPSAEVKSERV